MKNRMPPVGLLCFALVLGLLGTFAITGALRAQALQAPANHATVLPVAPVVALLTPGASPLFERSGSDAPTLAAAPATPDPRMNRGRRKHLATGLVLIVGVLLVVVLLDS